jgi:hypothetical protein
MPLNVMMPSGSHCQRFDLLLPLCDHSKHPVPVAPEVLRQEITAVRGVASRSCPITAVLDRVVVTSTGVVVSCWQVGDTQMRQLQ